MKPITQTLGGEVTEGAAFNLDAGAYRIEVAMTLQEESSPLAQFGMQAKDIRGQWQTAQDVDAVPIARLIQEDEESTESFTIEATLPTGPYRFTASSTTTVKITISSTE